MPSWLQLLVSVLLLGASAGIGVALLDKTGFNRGLGLLVVVPVANVILFLYLLVVPWPVRLELARRRLEAGDGRIEDGRLVYRGAERLQRRGGAENARRMFALVARCFPATETGRDAAISRDQIPESG